MDLFRSKKRDTDVASLEGFPSSLQKKRRGLSSSVDDILTAVEDDGGAETATDNSLSEDSEAEEIVRASKKQKIFAKKTIKWEKKKEKEQRKKIEKNLISMDDFLSKQSEFKMWLYEEKNKNAGEMTSPKLKVFFKQFVRLWNKKKLVPRYYRGSDLSSPKPRTPRRSDFMGTATVRPDPLTDVKTQGANIKTEGPETKNTQHSPFVTFGKTPPKVFRSKRLQLFGSSPDVALISVAPLGSPKPVVPPKPTNKENKPAVTELDERVSHYRTPVSKAESPLSTFVGIKKTVVKGENSVPDSGVRITPYKVSVFPWAVNENNMIDLDVCTTATPPNSSFGVTDTDADWPPPPTEAELKAVSCQSVKSTERVTQSPRVPPPPPPRVNKPTANSNEYCPLPSVTRLALTYSDPYDTLPEKRSPEAVSCQVSEYQDPVDSLHPVNATTGTEGVETALNYPLSEHVTPVSELYAKPVKSKTRRVERNIEELYAKPNKLKKARHIDEFNTKKTGVSKELNDKPFLIIEDPCYDCVETVLGQTSNGSNSDSDKSTSSEGRESNSSVSSKSPRIRKKGVLAASTDKIYETYLGMSRPKTIAKTNGHAFTELEDNKTVYANVLKKKFNSQPDISFSETGSSDMEIPTNNDITDGKVSSNGKQYLNSFGKPLNTSVSDQNITGEMSGDLYESIAAQSQNIRRFLEGVDTSQPKYVKLSVTRGDSEFECPGTPVIQSTPSFEALCDITPLSQRSGSSQSLPGQSVSHENLSALHNIKSQSCEDIPTASDIKSESDNYQVNRSTCGKSSSDEDEAKEKQMNCTPPDRKGDISENLMAAMTDGRIPITPGKISAAKHGIDLSVYLLKQPTPSSATCTATTGSQENTERHQVTSSSRNLTCRMAPPVAPKPVKRTINQSACRIPQNQSKLAVRETLSGVKTKVEPVPLKDQGCRHTAQTANEEISSLSTVPVIGIASKTLKMDITTHKTDPSRIKREVGQNADESDSKVASVEQTDQKSTKPGNYLETDIDMDTQFVDNRKPFTKSKSHSGFELGTSTVVTEIW